MIYGITRYHPTLGHLWAETELSIQQVQALIHRVLFSDFSKHTGSTPSGVGGRGWPCGRNAAKAWKIRGLVYMYGGTTGSYLNDLWSFNTTSMVWTLMGGMCNLPCKAILKVV